MEHNEGVLVFITCWFLMGCASTVELSSVVVDQESKRPIKGAVAKLVNQRDAVLDSALTDETGRFLFTLSKIDKKGRYRVVVVKTPLSEIDADDVQFNRKPPIKPEFVLPLWCAIEGEVKSEDGELVAEAIVVLIQDKQIVDQIETAPDGSFAIETLDPGEYSLRIKHFNHYPAQSNIFPIEQGQILRLNEDRALPVKRIKADEPMTFQQLLQQAEEEGDWSPLPRDIFPSERSLPRD